MTQRKFLFAAGGIIVFSLVIRLWPLLANNFYFTVDQGQNAVTVRNILVSHQLTLRGPETSVRGIYAGPLWYYFLAIGYLFFGGDPRGGVVMMILLNTFVLGFVIWWISRKLGHRTGLLVGLGLAIFWPFYETSAWAFNPFPIAALGLFLIYFLEKYLAGDNRSLIYSLLVILLSFNTDLASATALWLFAFLVGLYGVFKRRTSWRLFLALFFLPVALALLINGRSAANLALRSASVQDKNTGLGIFRGTNFATVSGAFFNIVGSTTIPLLPVWGILLVLLIIILNWQTIKRNAFARRYFWLTFVFLITSLGFFSLNRGWKDWQTVYLAPIVFIGLILLFLRKNQLVLSRLILIFVFILQFQYTFQRYINYPADKNDPSIIANRYKVIDWIYNQANSQGFGVYTYTKGYFDYPQQYLFWWYGHKKYGYLPCEYANIPGASKSDYIPQALDFSLPKKDCGNLRFLIIEDNTNGEKNKDWIIDYRENTKLDLSENVGGVTLEKRELTQGSNMLFDTQVYLQNYWDGPLHLMIPNSWPIAHSGDTTEAKYSDDLWLRAKKIQKDCLGLTLTEFKRLLGEKYQESKIISQKEETSGETNLYRVDLSLIDKTSSRQAVLVSSLFKGKANDYLVEVYRGGWLINAENLSTRILKSVEIIEDQETKTVRSCIN